MADFDAGTQRLIDDLLAKPPSFARDEILTRARRLYYHDYKSPYEAPQGPLIKHLTKAGFPDLAERVLDGRYDQPKGESDKWAEETAEGRELTKAAESDPRLRAMLDTMVKAAAEPAYGAQARALMLRCIRERDFRHRIFDDRKVKDPRKAN